MVRIHAIFYRLEGDREIRGAVEETELLRMFHESALAAHGAAIGARLLLRKCAARLPPRRSAMYVEWVQSAVCRVRLVIEETEQEIQGP